MEDRACARPPSQTDRGPILTGGICPVSPGTFNTPVDFGPLSNKSIFDQPLVRLPVRDTAHLNLEFLSGGSPVSVWAEERQGQLECVAFMVHICFVVFGRSASIAGNSGVRDIIRYRTWDVAIFLWPLVSEGPREPFPHSRTNKAIVADAQISLHSGSTAAANTASSQTVQCLPARRWAQRKRPGRREYKWNTAIELGC